MKDIKLELPDEYPYILLCIVILSFYLLALPYFLVIPKRNNIFNQKTVMTHDNMKEHLTAFGESSQMMLMAGFPDNGNGFFSDKLPYAKWYDLNNTLRVHQNFVESMP